jgi:hypothetical protein
MDLIDKLKTLFKYSPVDTDKIRGKLPFVHLFGYEKSYGKPHPHEFNRFIEAYKSWAYACAWKNGTSVAKCKLGLYKRMFIKGEEELDD